MIDPNATKTSLHVLFERWSRGERAALDEILTQFYGDIHSIAVRRWSTGKAWLTRELARR
jgi:hypothetical protein